MYGPATIQRSRSNRGFKMTVMNTGGRVSFEDSSEVRILKADGTISQEIYLVDTGKSDRKGQVTVREKGTHKILKVQFRRVLPINVYGKSAVIESGGKYKAICPQCVHIENVTPSDDNIVCPSHGDFQLFWIGIKPMADMNEKKPAAKRLVVKKELVAKKAKPVRKAIIVNLDNIAKTKHCELWTKIVPFDHDKFDVQSHALIYTYTVPRKMCFNTYNGTLGKKSEPLPIEEFTQDTPVAGKKLWYPVASLEKERNKLMKEGYELHNSISAEFAT